MTTPAAPDLVLVQYPADGELGPSPQTPIPMAHGGNAVVTWSLGEVRAVPPAVAASLCTPQGGFLRCERAAASQPKGCTKATYRPEGAPAVDVIVLDLATRRLLRAAAAKPTTPQTTAG